MQRSPHGGELQPGDRLAGYRLEAMLGQGGAGIVFRAVREADGQVVALKVLKRALSGDETQRRRFMHEARAAREVEHPNLVPILDVGDADGRTYLAVRYVDGRSLTEMLRGGTRLPVQQVLRITDGLAAGLDALHAQGIVHRDIKPSNVLVDQAGTAALTDFGLAKGRGYTALTRAGSAMGTIDYMAPEVIMGRNAGPPSDIYAFGCLVYECVTGGPPFAGKAFFQVGLAHLDEQPPDPVERRPGLPRGFAEALLHALAKEPAERPPSATAYHRGLELALDAPPA